LVLLCAAPFLTPRAKADACNFPFLWERRYLEPDQQTGSWAQAVTSDTNGNCYVAGCGVFEATGDDLITAKYDATGDLLWLRRFEEPANDQSRPAAIVLDRQTNVIVAGWSSLPESSGSGGFNYRTVKYDANGAQQWAATWQPAAPTNEPTAQCLTADDEGNVYVGGNVGTLKYRADGTPLWTNSCPAQAVQLGPGGQSVYLASGHGCGLIKLDTNGAPLWARSLPQNSPCYKLLAVDRYDCAYIAGSTNYDNIGVPCVLIEKFNPDGSLAWSAVYRGPPPHILRRPEALTIAEDGSVVVVGQSGYDPGAAMLVIKYGANGDLEWAGGSGAVGTDVRIDGEGSVYVTGYTPNTTPYHYDSVLLKYDSLGRCLWTGRYNSALGDDYAYLGAMALCGNGNIWVVGSASGFSSGSSTLQRQFTVLKYDQYTPRLVPAGPPLAGSFTACMVSKRGLAWSIESSTDLNHWTPRDTVTNWDGIVASVDSAATNVAKFYRARLTSGP